MEDAKTWAARIRAKEAARTPDQVAADERWMDVWLAGLPELPPVPQAAGECVAFFVGKPRPLMEEEPNRGEEGST